MASLAARGLSISSLQGNRFPQSFSTRFHETLWEKRGARCFVNSTEVARFAEATKPKSPPSPPKPAPKLPEAKKPNDEEQRKILSQLTYRVGGKTANVTKFLFTTAVHNNILAAVEKDAKWLIKTLNENRPLKLRMCDRLSSPKIFAYLQKEGKLNAFTVEFLQYLEKKKFMPELFKILNAFLEMCTNSRKEVIVELTVPKGFSPLQEKIIVNILKKKYMTAGSKPVIEKKEDRSLVGFIAEVAGFTVDGSINSSFRKTVKAFQDWFSSARDQEPVKKSKDKSKAKTFAQQAVDKVTQYVLDRLAKNPADKKAEKILTNVTNKRKMLALANYFKDQEPISSLMRRYADLLHESLHGKAKATAPKATVNPSKPNPAKAIDPKKRIPASVRVKKDLSADQLLRLISYRVRTNPLGEEILFQLQVREWKDALHLLDSEDPWHKTFTEAIKIVETKCHKVEYVPPKPSEIPYAFPNLKKMTAKELMNVPVAVMQELSPGQLSRLPIGEVRQLALKEMDFQPIDPAQVLNVDISKLQPVDVDVICMDINDQIRIFLNAKRFALQRWYFQSQKGVVNREKSDEFIRKWESKSVSELNKEFGLTIDNEVQKNLDKLLPLKAEVEARVRARGMTPLQDRLQW